uniref:Uncharacterized protein n=3 Tax=Photinus pyralis TaxID=7054 RepID=A0A1Y1M9N2_PHOPY
MRRRIRGILMSGKQFSLDSRLDLFHGIEGNKEISTASELTTTPLMEDSQENEGNYDDHECSTKTDNDFLIPPLNRHGRSRSVDHQGAMLITEPAIHKKCEKCGHLVSK